MQTKKLLSVLLLSFTLAMSACGTGGDSSPAESNSNDNSSTPGENNPDPNPNPEPTPDTRTREQKVLDNLTSLSNYTLSSNMTYTTTTPVSGGNAESATVMEQTQEVDGKKIKEGESHMSNVTVHPYSYVFSTDFPALLSSYAPFLIYQDVENDTSVAPENKSSEVSNRMAALTASLTENEAGVDAYIAFFTSHGTMFEGYEFENDKVNQTLRCDALMAMGGEEVTYYGWNEALKQPFRLVYRDDAFYSFQYELVSSHEGQDAVYSEYKDVVEDTIKAANFDESTSSYVITNWGNKPFESMSGTIEMNIDKALIKIDSNNQVVTMRVEASATNQSVEMQLDYSKVGTTSVTLPTDYTVPYYPYKHYKPEYDIYGASGHRAFTIYDNHYVADLESHTYNQELGLCLKCGYLEVENVYTNPNYNTANNKQFLILGKLKDNKIFYRGYDSVALSTDENMYSSNNFFYNDAAHRLTVVDELSLTPLPITGEHCYCLKPVSIKTYTFNIHDYETELKAYNPTIFDGDDLILNSNAIYTLSSYCQDTPAFLNSLSLIDNGDETAYKIEECHPVGDPHVEHDGCLTHTISQCSECGEYLDYESIQYNHTYSEWEVTTKPSAFNDNPSDYVYIATECDTCHKELVYIYPKDSCGQERYCYLYDVTTGYVADMNVVVPYLFDPTTHVSVIDPSVKEPKTIGLVDADHAIFHPGNVDIPTIRMTYYDDSYEDISYGDFEHFGVTCDLYSRDRNTLYQANVSSFNDYLDKGECTLKITYRGVTQYVDIDLVDHYTINVVSIDESVKGDDAWFALYSYYAPDDSIHEWTVYDEDNPTFTIDSQYTNFIFVRLRPSSASGYNFVNDGLNWDNKWNKTVNISLDYYKSNLSITGYGNDDIITDTYL